MTTNNKVVRIFMMPLTFPCGPQSACCGPMGQSDEEIQNLKAAIEGELNCFVEVKNIMVEEDVEAHPGISNLLQGLGPMALPIITLDDEIVSIGAPLPEEAVSALKERMNQTG